MKTGYHANDKVRCERFIEDSSYMIISNDKDFLGRGMYFWNLARAKSWMQEKKKEVIVSAEIDLSNELDITDEDVCKMLESMYDKISRAILNNVKKLESNSGIAFGLRLNAIFEAYGKYLDFNVIKGIQHTPNKHEYSFLENTRLTGKSVDIYCIRHISALGKRKKEIA